ncbi:MAG: hypothetical protein JXQ67_08025 [Campylobacterales bacterium]|nr:hypothetical protein [Campylobacterales bacterium]
MSKIGIGVDYSNICKDYNTAYLDRDNKDPATSRCMKKVLDWSSKFLDDLLKEFGYSLYYPSSSVAVKVEDVSSKRFLFYSLEKEITLQSFVAAKEYVEYASLGVWESDSKNSILIQNDEDGSCVYFFVDEGSLEKKWIEEKLKNFSLDEVEFTANR